jgi:hypothetical protein
MKMKIAESRNDHHSEAVKFYSDLGFTIDEFPMYAGDYELSTALRFHESFKERFIEILSSAKAWIMSPKPRRILRKPFSDRNLVNKSFQLPYHASECSGP